MNLPTGMRCGCERGRAWTHFTPQWGGKTGMGWNRVVVVQHHHGQVHRGDSGDGRDRARGDLITSRQVIRGGECKLIT